MRWDAWIAQRAASSPSRAALEIGDRVLRWDQLAALARSTAVELSELGVGDGDPVATLLPNGIGFVKLLHALDLRGAVLLPLNLRLSGQELQHQLRDSGARLLIHGSGDLAERARNAASELPGLRCVQLADDLDPGLEGGHVVAAPDLPRFVFDAPQAPQAIVYTSGTTGVPKGATLTRANFFWSAAGSAALLGVRPTDRWLACLPLFHVGGLSILLRSVLYGVCAVVHESFDPQAVNRAIDARGISHVSLVPTMLERIVEQRRGRRVPETLRCALIGGSPASRALLEDARALGFPVAPTYGLTEAASQVATSAPVRSGASEGLSMRVLPGTQVRIARPDGTNAPAEEAGEILVQGPTVMQGYWKRRRSSRETLRGGWLHTGDIGVLDESGGLRVIDRRSDLIVSGGENIYPAEIEAVLRDHPAVQEAAVAGVPDSRFGRRPAAWLIGRGEAQPSASELRDFCRNRLAAFKTPVDFTFVDQLPRNAAGKVIRDRLRKSAPATPAVSSR